MGIVEEVGAAVRHVQPGDRVFAPFGTSCGQCEFCPKDSTPRVSNRVLIYAIVDTNHERRASIISSIIRFQGEDVLNTGASVPDQASLTDW